MTISKPLRINEQIRISPIRLIDHNDEQRGVVPTSEAMALAREVGQDLVEVSPMERPPVCRIMDYGKYKYTQKKKAKQRTGHEIELKEIRLRPKTDPHDLMIKLNKAREFLEDGNKVQFTMQFRGREKAHQEIALDMFREIVTTFADVAKIERPPLMEGKRMIMILVSAPRKGGGAGHASGPVAAPVPSAMAAGSISSRPRL